MNKKHIKAKKMSKECWNLDRAFVFWLNEHVKVYYKDAKNVVDLSFHKFDYDGEELTQEEVIIKMIEISDFLINQKYIIDYDEKLDELLELWKIVCPAMWW